MAASALTTRRAALVGALASTTALAVPAIAASHVAEHPNDKVRRLGREMSVSLRDPGFVGFNRVTVTPTGLIYDDADVSFGAMQDAIDQHDAAWEAFNESCPWGDTSDPSYSEKGAAMMEERSEREEEAFLRLLSLRPASLAEANLKLEYVFSNVPHRWQMIDQSQVDALLSSTI